MGIAMSGIGGFDTSSIVTQLMALERQAGNKYTTKRSELKAGVSAYTVMNARLKDVTKSAWAIMGKESKTDSILEPGLVWAATKGTSNKEAVKIDAAAGAAVGSVEFDVKSLAQTKQVVQAQSQVNEMVQGNKFTIATGDKVAVIDTASSDINDVAKAINAQKDLGISATVVRIGDGDDGKGVFSLQLTGSVTGAKEGDFKLYAGDQGAALAGTATETTTENGATTYKFADASAASTALAGVTQAQANVARESSNAVITLHGVDRTYKSNNIEIMSGVKMDLSGLTQETDAAGNAVVGADGSKLLAKGVKIEVAADNSAASDKVKAMVNDLNNILTDLTAGMKSTDKTAYDADGKSYTYKKPGDFSNSMGRSLKDGISNMLSSGVTLENADGTTSLHSLEEFGISLKLDGSKELTVSYDAEKFQKAMDADPAKAEKVVTALAEKVATFGQEMSDSKDGLVTGYIKSQEDQVSYYSDRISDFEDRMAAKEAAMKKQYANLETMLAQYNAKFSQIQGQLASLGGYSSTQ